MTFLDTDVEDRMISIVVASLGVGSVVLIVAFVLFAFCLFYLAKLSCFLFHFGLKRLFKNSLIGDMAKAARDKLCPIIPVEPPPAKLSEKADQPTG